MPINLSLQNLAAIITGTVAITTAIFWGAFLLGRLWNRLEWVERRVDEHDAAIREFKGLGV